MPFPRPTIEEIYRRIKADMESRLTGGIPIPRISWNGIMALVFSGAIHLNYGFLVWAAKQLFVDTATSFGRERWSRILKVPRKSPTYTTGFVAFTGTNGVTVGSGTTLINSEGYEYTTQAAFTIGTDAAVEVRAVDTGDVYNTIDTYLDVSSVIPNVDSVAQIVVDPDTGDVGFTNGTDLETIESWVYHMLVALQNPAHSGSASDYERWCLDVPGVGRSWCVPSSLWSGGTGELGVFVATEGLDPVSAGVLASVGTYVESVRPAPAVVQYATINLVPITYVIGLSPNNAEMRAAVRAELDSLFKLESGPGETILLSHQRNAIAAAGPDDYKIFAIYVDGNYIGVDDIDSVYPDTPRYSYATIVDM